MDEPLELTGALQNPVEPDPEPTGPVPPQAEVPPTPIPSTVEAPSPEPELVAGKHPLEPGGKRFNEVWARAKRAEAALQRAREQQIRAETELEVRKQTPATPATPGERILTWDELEKGIESGQLTRAQANEYRDGVIEKRVTERLEKKLLATTSDQTRSQSLSSELTRYKQAVPNIVQLGTPERDKLESEFAWQLSTYGVTDPRTLTALQRTSLELAATRAVFGPVESLERKPTVTPKRETHQETSGDTGRPTGPQHDSLDDLTSEEKMFYTKLIKQGKYAGWDAVRKDVDWYNEHKATEAKRKALAMT